MLDAVVMAKVSEKRERLVGTIGAIMLPPERVTVVKVSLVLFKTLTLLLSFSMITKWPSFSEIQAGLLS
jgi:hypothetical protein